MGKPKQPKSDAKGKGSVSSKDRSPSKETKSKEAKTPESGAATPSKRGQSQGKAGSAWPPPLNRPIMAPLLLPSDYSMDEPRRPSKIYVWEWDNVWFFPVGLLAISVIVLGMVVMWYDDLPDRDTRGSSNNATSLAVNDTGNATEEDSLTTLHGPQLLLPDHDDKGDMSTELEEEGATTSTFRTHQVPDKGAHPGIASPKATGPKAPQNPREPEQGSSAGSLKSSTSSFSKSETVSGGESSTSPARFLGTSKKIDGSSVGPSAQLVTPSTTQRSPTVETSSQAPTSGSTENSSGESTS
ncbi:hypothetical protein MTO96_035444 [Rhipicephalus appendiculatus]